MGCVAVIIGRVIGGDRPARNDFGTQPGIGREHAMEACDLRNEELTTLTL
jgi:hypothetical protein